MFEGIKKRWAEARGDVACKEVEDILNRYSRMDANSRYWVSSAFASVLSELEDQLGPLDAWSRDQKKDVSKQVMASSRQAVGTPGSNVHAHTRAWTH